MMIVDQLRNLLLDRQRAYWHTFGEKNLAAQAVLEDLARFCRATESTWRADPREHALLEGRKEVWLRIQQHLKLDEAALWELTKRQLKE